MAVTFKNPTVEINGVTYEAELMEVEYTHLGWEDHGIFSACVGMQTPNGGVGQGFGHFGLGEGKWGIAFLKSVLKCFGGCDWENLKGKKAWVLREEPYGFISGFLSVDKEHSFIPKIDLAHLLSEN